LKEWLIAASEEFNVFIGQAISPSLKKIVTFVENISIELGIRRDLMMKEIFGIDSRYSS